ncbi:hypothetical protein GCM10009020_07290 [Natronoarchaeum mannanilyticum]|uniref:Uncharacterized protein n=1 Tax=Natronoarchaeum mannanilyticum TaxID=926360 RepID=A0AAV3T5W2_9EURY
MLPLPEEPLVPRLVESDAAFYVGVGAFAVAVFVCGVAAGIASGAIDPSRRELVGFGVGFGLFTCSYLFAIVAYRHIQR